MKDTTAARGYGAAHQRKRAKWQKRINSGETIICWRCAEKGEPHPIRPGDEWDLGHDDDDRTQYRGPECASGNRATAGRKEASTELNSQAW